MSGRLLKKRFKPGRARRTPKIRFPLDRAKAIVMAATTEEFDVVERALTQYVRDKSQEPTTQATITRHVKPDSSPLPNGVLEVTDQLLALMDPSSHNRKKDFGKEDEGAQLVIAVRRMTYDGREGYAVIVLVIQHSIVMFVAQRDMMELNNPNAKHTIDPDKTLFDHLEEVVVEALTKAEQ